MEFLITFLFDGKQLLSHPIFVNYDSILDNRPTEDFLSKLGLAFCALLGYSSFDVLGVSRL